MVLARWAGPTILRYVSEAPLAHITSDVKRLMAGEELHDVLLEVSARAKEVDEKLAELASAEAELAEQIAHMKLAGASPGFVANHKSGAWHRVLFDGISYLPCHWKTCCGWKFGDSAVTRSAEIPESVPWYLRCERCLTSERAASKAAQGADDALCDPRDLE